MLIAILFIPFVWLFVVRGGFMLGRYVKENAPMNLIFRRSAKFYLFSFLGLAGYVAMGLWAQFSVKFIVAMIAK